MTEVTIRPLEPLTLEQREQALNVELAMRGFVRIQRMTIEEALALYPDRRAELTAEPPAPSWLIPPEPPSPRTRRKRRPR